MCVREVGETAHTFYVAKSKSKLKIGRSKATYLESTTGLSTTRHVVKGHHESEEDGEPKHAFITNSLHRRNLVFADELLFDHHLHRHNKLRHDNKDVSQERLGGRGVVTGSDDTRESIVATAWREGMGGGRGRRGVSWEESKACVKVGATTSKGMNEREEREREQQKGGYSLSRSFESKTKTKNKIKIKRTQRERDRQVRGTCRTS